MHSHLHAHTHTHTHSHTHTHTHTHTNTYTHTNTHTESFEEADIAVLSYLSIFARTILSVPNVLTDILEAVIRSTELSKIFCITVESSVVDKTKAQQSLFTMLVRLMIDKFDSVAYCTTGAWRRKLWYVEKTLNLDSMMSMHHF